MWGRKKKPANKLWNKHFDCFRFQFLGGNGQTKQLEKGSPACQNIRDHGFRNFFWVNDQLLNCSSFEFLCSSCHCLSKYQTCSAMSYNKYMYIVLWVQTVVVDTPRLDPGLTHLTWQTSDHIYIIFAVQQMKWSFLL